MATSEPTITMNRNTEDRQFAFGENERDGCPCPIAAVGENPESSAYIEIAELYDDFVGQRLGIGWGKVPEEVAKEEWLDVIDQFGQTGMDPFYRENAREVAAELGWLED